jgi:hypothetical protein
MGELKMKQTDLFPPPPTGPREPPGPGTIQARFERFHRRNPQVYVHLVKQTRRLKAMGHRHISIKMLWEHLRCEWMLKTTDDSEFKLCNDYHSRYARLIMEQEPDLEGIFETRELLRE